MFQDRGHGTSVSAWSITKQLPGGAESVACEASSKAATAAGAAGVDADRLRTQDASQFLEDDMRQAAKRDRARRGLLREVEDAEMAPPILVETVPAPDYSYLVGKTPRELDIYGNPHDLPGLTLGRTCQCGLVGPVLPGTRKGDPFAGAPCKSCLAWFGPGGGLAGQTHQSSGLMIVGFLVLLVVGIMVASAEDSPGRDVPTTVELD